MIVGDIAFPIFNGVGFFVSCGVSVKGGLVKSFISLAVDVLFAIRGAVFTAISLSLAIAISKAGQVVYEVFFRGGYRA